MINIDLDHKTIASYFNKSAEGMRKLKRKYEAGKSNLWKIYVKAYNYDTGVQNGNADTGI